MRQILNSLKKWMANANTEPVLASSLMICIQLWLQFGRQPSVDKINFNTKANNKNEIRKAIETQQQIGAATSSKPILLSIGEI